MQSELQTGSLLSDYNHNWSWSTNVSKIVIMSSSPQQNLMRQARPVVQIT
jgi:hypothetical protein